MLVLLCSKVYLFGYKKNAFLSFKISDFCSLWVSYRSSYPKVFCKKSVLRNFAKFTGKHLCHSLLCLSPPVPQPQACNFIKRETLAQVFSCEFYKIFKNTFSYITPPVVASGVIYSKRLMERLDCKILSVHKNKPNVIEKDLITT